MIEKAKKVITYDAEGKENGYLIELLKDGEKTLSYLTAALPKAFKGFHLHKVRESNYVCIKGSLVILLARNRKIETIILSEGDKLNIPINVPTALWNPYTNGEAWLINFPDPPYDPNLKDEQIDIDPKEIKSWLKENG